MDKNIFHKLSDSDLVSSYGALLIEMRKRGIIRSKNVVGDLGEFIAIDYYSKTRGLPKLQFAPLSTKNIDAISIAGERYTIKTTTTTTTGTFFGLEKDVDINSVKPAFEYLIIVKLDDAYSPELILEVDWCTFYRHKRWDSRMKAYHLSISKKLIEESKIIYQKQ